MAFRGQDLPDEGLSLIERVCSCRCARGGPVALSGPAEAAPLLPCPVLAALFVCGQQGGRGQKNYEALELNA